MEEDAGRVRRETEQRQRESTSGHTTTGRLTAVSGPLLLGVRHFPSLLCLPACLAQRGPEPCKPAHFALEANANEEGGDSADATGAELGGANTKGFAAPAAVVAAGVNENEAAANAFAAAANIG